MRSLRAIVAAVVTASLALSATAPAFAGPDRRDHRREWRKPERVVVIDRHDSRHHAPPPRHKVVHVRDRHHYAPPPRVVYVKDRHHYDRYSHHHDHHRKKDNTGEVLLGIGLGAAALAGILAATND